MTAGRFMLVMDLGGYTLRLATSPATVDGEVYPGGLDVGALGFTDEKAKVTVSQWEPPGGWGAFIATYGSLEERTAAIYWHRDGESLQEARLVLRGRAVDTEYGGPGEPLDFTLVAAVGGQELMPPPTAVITLQDWSTAKDSALGKSPPILFGYPGTRGDTGNSLPAVPALYVSVGGTGFLALAQGSIAATTCNVARVSGGSGVYSNWTSAPVSETTKGGRTVTQIQADGSQPSGFFVDDGEYFLHFSAADSTHGGVARPDGTPLRGQQR